jgi:hypothetical protein
MKLCSGLENNCLTAVCNTVSDDILFKLETFFEAFYIKKFIVRLRKVREAAIRVCLKILYSSS